MSDLVQKARDAANGVGTMKSDHGDYGLLDDLADEIEGLRQRVAELGQIGTDYLMEIGELKAKLAQAERERDEYRLTVEQGMHYLSPKYRDGFSAGIEAAAGINGWWLTMNGDGEPDGTYCSVCPEGEPKSTKYVSADLIRNLSPAPPTDTVRQAAEVLLDAYGDKWSGDPQIAILLERIPLAALRALAARGGE